MDDSHLFECKSPDFSLLELLDPPCLDLPEGGLGLGLDICDPPPLTDTLLGLSARFAPELVHGDPSPLEPPGSCPHASPPYRVPDSAILSLRREADKLEPLLAGGPRPLTSSCPCPSSCPGDESQCSCHHSPGAWSPRPPSPRPWVWLLRHTQGDSADPVPLTVDSPQPGPAVASAPQDVLSGGGASPPSAAAPGTGGWGREEGVRAEAGSAQDPSGSEGEGRGATDAPPAPARLRTPRKQPHPQRSPQGEDPDFQGVTVRMERRMEGPGEWGLRITARYSPGLQHRLSRLRRPRLRPLTPGSPPSSEEEEAAGPGQPLVRRCASCDTQKTPLWRDAEDGTPLCNACGIRYKKYRLRCPRCWHIPRKEGKCFVHCVRCGDPLRLLLNVRKGGGS